MYIVLIINTTQLKCVSGETDFLKPYGLELLKSFVDPVVIHHPKGHTVPRLGTLIILIPNH